MAERLAWRAPRLGRGRESGLPSSDSPLSTAPPGPGQAGPRRAPASAAGCRHPVRPVRRPGSRPVGRRRPGLHPPARARLSEAFPNASLTMVPGGRTFLPLDSPAEVASEVAAAAGGQVCLTSGRPYRDITVVIMVAGCCKGVSSWQRGKRRCPPNASRAGTGVRGSGASWELRGLVLSVGLRAGQPRHRCRVGRTADVCHDLAGLTLLWNPALWGSVPATGFVQA